MSFSLYHSSCSRSINSKQYMVLWECCDLLLAKLVVLFSEVFLARGGLFFIEQYWTREFKLSALDSGAYIRQVFQKSDVKNKISVGGGIFDLVLFVWSVVFIQIESTLLLQLILVNILAFNKLFISIGILHHFDTYLSIIITLVGFWIDSTCNKYRKCTSQCCSRPF